MPPAIISLRLLACCLSFSFYQTSHVADFTHLPFFLRVTENNWWDDDDVAGIVLYTPSLQQGSWDQHYRNVSAIGECNIIVWVAGVNMSELRIFRKYVIFRMVYSICCNM